MLDLSTSLGGRQKSLKLQGQATHSDALCLLQGQDHHLDEGLNDPLTPSLGPAGAKEARAPLSAEQPDTMSTCLAHGLQ